MESRRSKTLLVDGGKKTKSTHKINKKENQTKKGCRKNNVALQRRGVKYREKKNHRKNINQSQIKKQDKNNNGKRKKRESPWM